MRISKFKYGTPVDIVEIIYCYWHTDENSDQPECKREPGYEYGKLDNTTFTLKIPAATEENLGKYQCQQLPSDPTHDNTEVIAVVVVVLVVLLAAAPVVAFCWRKRLRARCRSEECGLCFSKSLDGKGAAVKEEQSPMLDETTATTFDTTQVGQALKVLDETGVVLIAAPEKIEKTMIGQTDRKSDVTQSPSGKPFTKPSTSSRQEGDLKENEVEPEEPSSVNLANSRQSTDRKSDVPQSPHGKPSTKPSTPPRQEGDLKEKEVEPEEPPSVNLANSRQSTDRKSDVTQSPSGKPFTKPSTSSRQEGDLKENEVEPEEPSSVNLANSRQSTDRKSDVTQLPSGKPFTKPSTSSRQEGDLKENEVEPEEPSSVNLANSRQSTDRKSDVTQSPNGKPSTKPSTPPRQEGDLKEKEVEPEDRNLHLVISNVPESKAKGFGAIYEDEENRVKAILKEAGLSDSELNEVTELPIKTLQQPYPQKVNLKANDNTPVIAVVVSLVAFLVAAGVVVVFVCRKRLRARCRSEESGVSFSKSLDGKGAAVREEQSPMLEETTATTFDTTQVGQALKVLDETGVVLIAGPEKIEKTKTGQDLLRYCTDKGYTQIQLHNLRGWSQYAEDREKKYLILMGGGITNDPSVTERAWSSFLRQARERQCVVVVTVRSSEKSEESVKAGLFPFLQSVPTVLLPAATTESKEVLPSRRAIAPPSETHPKSDVNSAEAPGESSSENLANSRQSTERKSDVTQSPSGKPSTKPSTPPRQEGDFKINEVEPEDRNLHLVISNVPESKAKGFGAIYDDEENSVKAILKQAGIGDSELDEVTEVMRLGDERRDGATRTLRFRVERGATKRKILKSAKMINRVKDANGMNVHICEYDSESKK
ncbi:hypothetical protein BaRGS_00035027 [Batillaria attramentaria]|uniref:Novel STAND NTPase 3 domain-containing protein n=1 Tax=Batillaria attramentaria TaxID=370345 RepID=A0ABD0JFQ9_9CAEN